MQTENGLTLRRSLSPGGQSYKVGETVQRPGRRLCSPQVGCKLGRALRCEQAPVALPAVVEGDVRELYQILVDDLV